MIEYEEQMSPQDIRIIREMLGLTQAEAGEIIGGGPRAFTKYEAGTVKPAASVVNLLRLLEANPRGIDVLKPDRQRPIPDVPNSPFEVAGDHVSALNEQMLPVLTRKLLNAEADAYDLPAPVIHVASNIHAADGGEDARITWEGGPSETRFLPSRTSQFQLKSGSIGRAAAGKEILNKDGSVKGQVCSFLQQGGQYILLCTHNYAQKEIQERENSIRRALREAGLVISDGQVMFRDAGQIANWVNRYPAVAVWLKELIQPGTVGPFQSWVHWAGDAEHDRSPWVEDERLPDLKRDLHQLITEPQGVARVAGISGVGKTRLVMEALGKSVGREDTGRSFNDHVMYTSQSKFSSETITGVVQTLADIRRRAIVVIDDCDIQNHRVLSAMVQRQGSRLSLVTIDSEVSAGTLDDTTIKVDEASPAVTDAIIDQNLPGLDSEDRRRLSRFSRGFPRIAVELTRIWPKGQPVVNATDDDLADAFVLGRRPREKEILLQSAELLSAFDLVRVDATADGDLTEVAGLGRQLSVENFRFAINNLSARGIVQQRGGLVRLQPRPIALRLAERQWRSWTPECWAHVLGGRLSIHLKVTAARQLAFLNDTTVAGEVVRSVCGSGGPFEGVEGVLTVGHCEILSALAEIEAETVLNQLERSLNEVEDLATLTGAARDHLRWALLKIAFLPDTFAGAAHLLLRLEASGGGPPSNDPKFGFPGLFPVLLGGTAATGRARLDLLDELSNELFNTGSTAMQLVVVKALSAGLETDNFSHMSGPEVHGARPALRYWVPTNEAEANEYISGCLTRIAELSLRNDEAGDLARTDLGHSLRSLVRHGFIDSVESVVRQVKDSVGFWSEAIRNLNFLLVYDAKTISPDVVTRVQALVSELKPKSIEFRVQAMVTEMGWIDGIDADNADLRQRFESQAISVRGLASELVEQPPVLAGLIPQLSGGRQAMTYVLGQAIARLSNPPSAWLEPITQALAQLSESERNFELLAGYVAGIAEKHPEFPSKFQNDLIRSPELAMGFPVIATRLGITPSDVELVVRALKEGRLSPVQLKIWSYGSVLNNIPAPTVATLIDAILDHGPDGFAVAVEMMHLYAFGREEELDGLRPQILKLAESTPSQDEDPDRVMTGYHFKEVIEWVLGKGRQDEEARGTALILSKNLANSENFLEDRLITQVVPTLLRDFPEITWPLVSQAIVSDDVRDLRLRMMLGNAHSFDHEPSSIILHLPEDVLFAWCHADQDHGPAFAAATMPFLTTRDPQAIDRTLHPSMARLIGEFGERIDVQRAIERNIHSFGWMGSAATYYEIYDAPVRDLLRHEKPPVRRWAKGMLRRLNATIQQERTREEEREARWE